MALEIVFVMVVAAVVAATVAADVAAAGRLMSSLVSTQSNALTAFKTSARSINTRLRSNVGQSDTLKRGRGVNGSMVYSSNNHLN